MANDWNKYRDKIIGLGEHSLHKSYYPELQKKIDSLEASQKNLQTIINSISDAIIIHDVNGQILSINEQTQSTFNIDLNDCSKYCILDISSPKLNYEYLEVLWKEVIKNKAHIIEWVGHPIGSKEEIELQVSVSSTVWNGKDAIVAVLRDFTERKKFEQDIILAKEKAEEASRLKSEFLKNMSHEIRTPMNGIIGFAEMLAEKDLLFEERTYYSKIVQDNSFELLKIIDNILEISKLVAKQIPLKEKSFCLNKLLINISDEYALESKNNNIPIQISKNVDHKEFIIYSDKTKLKKIIKNLIDNAFKFTDEGFIEIGYYVDAAKLILYVKDTGIGVFSKNHEFIFERFSKVNTELSRSGGLGLGLAISQEYARLLNGNITIESKKDKGSTFYVTIPYKGF